MLCAYCHWEVAEDAQSCAHCGAEVGAFATSGRPVGTPSTVGTPSPVATATYPGRPLNPELYKLHTFFSYLYLFAAIAVLVVCLVVSRSGLLIGLLIGLLAGFFFLGLAALHRYAAKGARFGKNSGRATSFAIACVWLLGFPIGTILAIYIFTKIFKSWEEGVEDEARAAVAVAGDW